MIIKSEIKNQTGIFRKNNKPQTAGFTLLEMIVSLGIFALVAVIAVGSLVRITGLNRQAQSLQSAMNDVSFVMESISREIRFGTKIRCVNGNSVNAGSIDSATGNCNTEGSKGVVFRSSTPGTGNSSYPVCQLAYAYWFNSGSEHNTVLKKSKQDHCQDTLSIDTASDLFDLTNLTIEDVNFDITSSGGYSLVKFGVKGSAGKKDSEKNTFDVHTAVSQRIAN